MLNFRVTFLLLLIFLTMYSCSETKTDHKIDKGKMKEIVKSQNEILESYFKTGNVEKLSMLYTESAKLSPNGNDFVFGRDSIKAFWANDFKTSKVLEMTTNVLTTDGTEDVIYETGKTMTKTLYMDSIYISKVKYINVWVKQSGGSYKLDIDFWNKD